jgi:parallel beta-helix repeat protein
MPVPTEPLVVKPQCSRSYRHAAILLSSFSLLSLLTGCAQSKWQLQEAKSGSGGNRNAAPGQPPDTNACINLASQGGNLQGAIDNAKNTAAQCLYVPPGTYNFGGHISINGVKLIGDGDSSILCAILSAGASLQIQGTEGGIYSLKVVTPLDNKCATGVRCEGRTTNDFAIFIANGATNWVINNVTIDGSRALGIQTFGAHNGRITNNRIMNTMAGGIHLTNGAYNCMLRVIPPIMLLMMSLALPAVISRTVLIVMIF